MGIKATQKAKLFIGGVKAQQSADFTASDFTSETWVAIGWLEDLGEIGDEAEAITFDAIGEGRRLKLKGVRDAGTMEVKLGCDPADPGQIALFAAEATPDDYSFKLEWNDAPPQVTSPNTGTPTRRLFIAQVGAVKEGYGSANDVIRLNVTLNVNSNVVRAAQVLDT